MCSPPPPVTPPPLKSRAPPPPIALAPAAHSPPRLSRDGASLLSFAPQTRSTTSFRSSTPPIYYFYSDIGIYILSGTGRLLAADGEPQHYTERLRAALCIDGVYRVGVQHTCGVHYAVWYRCRDNCEYA
jgi:hypothetical protein